MAKSKSNTQIAPVLKEQVKAQEVIDKIKLVSFAIDFMKDPEDAILSRSIKIIEGENEVQDMTGQVYERWSNVRFESLVKVVSELTGADPEQIRDPATRTPEQQRVMQEVEEKVFEHRIDEFFKSRYYQAFQYLNAIEGKYHDEHDGDAGYIDTKEQAILYFFATHENIKPNDTKPLSGKSKGELKDIFQRLDTFYMNNPLREGYSSEEGYATFFNFIEQEIQPKPSKKLFAEKQGAITSIGERLFVPSDPEFQDAFITKIGNSSIGLFKKDPNGGKKQLVLDINIEFIRALAMAIFIDTANEKKGETIVYFPQLAKELGYDLNTKIKNDDNNNNGTQTKSIIIPSRAETRERFINSLIDELDNIWGKLPKDSTEYKLIAVHTYNPETEMLGFVSPYLQHLLDALMDKENSQIESGKHYYNGTCDLLHTTAANERNHAAVEMAVWILVGLQRRGLTKPDAKLPKNKGKQITDTKLITYSITCASLIKSCPQIREKLKEQETASKKTQVLHRAFTAMYRVLKNKTDLFAYYIDLSMTEIIPTSKTLDTRIVIKHHGANPNYAKPFLPLPDEEEILNDEES